MARHDMAVRLAEQAEVLRWRGMDAEADAAAVRAAWLAGWPPSGRQRPKGHYEPGLRPALPWLDPSRPPLAGGTGFACSVALHYRAATLSQISYEIQ
jgi:hypothetical protein